MTLSDYLGIASILLTLVFGGLGIWYYYDGIQKKLNLLLEAQQEKQPLSKQQALDLLEVYLSVVLHDMKSEIYDFHEKELDDLIRTENHTEASNRITDIAEKSIKRFRGHLKLFKLKNGNDFASFLEEHSPINEGIIEAAKKEAAGIMRTTFESRPNSKAIRSEIFAVMTKASVEAKKRLTKGIERVYAIP